VTGQSKVPYLEAEFEGKCKKELEGGQSAHCRVVAARRFTPC
jgi:hypothetical protein